MDKQKIERMRTGRGFIAALDQSGGSTPKALAAYGIMEDAYSNEKEMYEMVHAMRTRIITSKAFTKNHILGAILFEQTMESEIKGMATADYLWDTCEILPFLKVDKGLADLADGVQMMKPNSGLDTLLKRAVEKHIFGTKMRSVIKEANPTGIKKVIDQQFEIGMKIASYGLVPIIEPEVDIHSAEKEKCEEILKQEIKAHIDAMPKNTLIMLKLTIPTIADTYKEFTEYPQVVRVVALSGGYSAEKANALLANNHGMIASFSRALAQDLRASQSQEEFDCILGAAVKTIYDASIT